MYDKYLRKVIKTCHVMIVLDLKDKAARYRMKKMRKDLGKQPYHELTLQDLITCSGLLVENVLITLGWIETKKS